MIYFTARTAAAVALAVPAGAAFLATGPADSGQAAPAVAVHAPAEVSPPATAPPETAPSTTAPPATVTPATGLAPASAGRPAGEREAAAGGQAIEAGQDEPEREPRVLGTFSDGGRLPEGLDLADAPVSVGRGSTAGPAVGADDLSGGPWCNVQCITKGVAYEHGTGVEIVVETSVQAQILVTVVRDVDGDDIPDLIGSANTPGVDTQLHLVLEDLEPGATYYGMATATDVYGNTSYAWGHFTMP